MEIHTDHLGRINSFLKTPHFNYPLLKPGILKSKPMLYSMSIENCIPTQINNRYYEGGTSSFYVWDKDDGDFACAFLVKKELENFKGIEKGSWNSINIIDIKTDSNKSKTNYKITTNLILELHVQSDALGVVDIGGNLMKQKEDSQSGLAKEEDHLARIGALVEENESWMRSNMEAIYMGKTKEIIFDARKIEGTEIDKIREKVIQELYVKKTPQEQN